MPFAIACDPHQIHYFGGALHGHGARGTGLGRRAAKTREGAWQ